MWCKRDVFCFYMFFVIIGIAPFIQSASLVYYSSSLDNATEVPLNQAENLMPMLNTEFFTIFYTYGFTGLPTDAVTENILSTYLSFGNYNVILLNWTAESTNTYPSTVLGYAFHAAPNAIRVGESLALAIVKLVGLGLKATKIHLIGLSLGAQLMGYAGRKAKEQGVTIIRATGLDPACPFFDPSLGYIPINQNTAQFVDVLHTDIGHCGMVSGTGHVDFFFNYENYLDGTNSQPGCDTDFDLCGSICSHFRAVYFWVEALNTPKAFLAGKASSYQNYVYANGIFNITTYVGALANTSYRGNFYLSTNAASPYGRKEAGLKP